MKYCSVKLSVVLVNLLFYIENATAIMCYDCNSLYDPRCGENFDSFSLGVVNCSMKEPLDHLPGLTPNTCRSIKMQIEGKTRVVRQCGFLPNDREQPCYRQSGTGDVFTTYCTCNTDLCNHGNVLHVWMAEWGFLVLVSLGLVF